MSININSSTTFGDDDANYDENDAVWQEEEKDELDEFGFKKDGDDDDDDDEDEEEEKKETVVAEEEEIEEEEEEEEEEMEGFGIEKDV